MSGENYQNNILLSSGKESFSINKDQDNGPYFKNTSSSSTDNCHQYHADKERNHSTSEKDTFLNRQSSFQVEFEKGRKLPQEFTDWSDDEDLDRLDNFEENKKVNFLSKVVITIQENILSLYSTVRKWTKGKLISTLFLIGFFVYFILAMNYRFGDEASIRLLVCTILGVLISTRHLIFKFFRWVFRRVKSAKMFRFITKKRVQFAIFIFRWLCYGGVAAVIIMTLIEKGIKDPHNLRSLPGLFIFMIICLLFSTNPGKINFHTLFWSIGLQFMAALLVLKWAGGKDAVMWIQSRLDEFFANSEAGSKLLFGDSYKDHYFLFGALPIVFLVNATLSVLYYLGAMQFVIKMIGNALAFVLDVSAIESMSVCAGIFMEGVAATLALRPFLPTLSKSELFVVITSVFSSLGGAYVAILSSIGVSLEFIIPAMVVSAPATFTVCKLMVPETTQVRKKYKVLSKGDIVLGEDGNENHSNILEAFQAGASSMLTLVGNVAVTAFAFFSAHSWINKTFNWFGDRVGIHQLSIELISSYILYPVSLAMGIELEDCRRVAMLLGYRIWTSNIIAFMKLSEFKINKMIYQAYMQQTNFTGPVEYTRDDINLVWMNKTLPGGFISERSEAIITYCLCGFSSFLSVAITLGIFFTLVPNRRKWISTITIPALVAGNVANCMTGCFASIFY